MTQCCTLCSFWGFGQTIGDYRSNGTVDFNSFAAAALGNANTITLQSARTLRFLTSVNFASNTNFTIILKGTIATSVVVTVN